MTSIADHAVKIQTTSESNPATPCWFGEVVLISSHLRTHGILNKINEQVRFARKRFGRYELIDFLAVLFGYAISGERTLEEFYESLQPFAVPFMTLFERDRLPSRSALSRFLAALTEAPVEALRTLFLDDLLARPLTHDKQTGGLVDRAGSLWIVFDIDGTREAARQRALPQTDDLPRLAVDWTRSVRLATPDASGGKSFAHAQPLARRTVTTGSAVLETVATGDIAWNSERHWLRSPAISLCLSSTLRAHCCGSMGNMGPEPCSRTWLASLL